MSQSVSNGNGANRIVWAVAAVLALGYLSLQAWTATTLVAVLARLEAIETRQELTDDRP